MTMKLINILNEDEVDYKLLNNLRYIWVPFEYGNVYLNGTYKINSESNDITLPISIRLNKIEPDMFDKAYLAFAQKIKSSFGDKYNLENIKLKIDDYVEGDMFGDLNLNIDLMPFLSVATKNTFRYDKPSVEKILKGGYHVDVNMDLLPHVTDDTYDMINKKKEHGMGVFEFLEDGTLSNGTSYKLIFESILLSHSHKESSGRHLDYSDINIGLFVNIDNDHPLTDDEQNELKKMFRMYDVRLFFR
jgi:hypothetical protein